MVVKDQVVIPATDQGTTKSLYNPRVNKIIYHHQGCEFNALKNN